MARVGELLPPSPPASLIHGDVWSGNVLARQGRIAAFIDPAPYHAHAEVELAFITLFSTFSSAFFERYQERLDALLSDATAASPAATPGRSPAVLGQQPAEFFDPAAFTATRRDLYNLYPLLVHCTLFGAGYATQVDSSLSRLGF
jgi:fructosamine-3-kinase